MSLFSFSRLSRGRLANWWWTVDKTTLSMVLGLTFIGAFLVFSSSPSVARRIGAPEYHFIKRQIVFIFAALGIIFFLSMQRLKNIRRIAIVGYVISLILVGVTFVAGFETKGASRWISVFGFSLQPTEFLKPTFIVVTAWLLDGSKKFEDFPGGILSLILVGITCLSTYLQPDMGMTIIIAVIWGFQLFLAGLPMIWISVLGLLGILGITAAYLTVDHFRGRILGFFSDETGYQVQKSLDSFANGNLLGRGPGEGSVKLNLPDAHTDFIFAVAGEEFGVWLCLIIVLLFAAIVIRSLWLSMKENNLFITYAVAGLAASFGLQGIINMASTMRLGPTKGMTLPFISYGGSSLLASAVTIGMLLALTRRNSSAVDKDYTD